MPITATPRVGLLEKELLRRLTVHGKPVSLKQLFERKPGYEPPTWATNAGDQLLVMGLVTEDAHGVITVTAAGRAAVGA